MEGCKKKVLFETEVKARQSQEYELNLSRQLARVSHHRDEAVRARGYDPLTNQPFEGAGAKTLAPSRQTVRACVRASVRRGRASVRAGRRVCAPAFVTAPPPPRRLPSSSQVV